MKNVIEKIANKTGYSVSHVTNVIAGRRNNKEISTLYNKFITPKTNKKSKKTMSLNTIVEKIANKTSYSVSHVRHVLNGSRYNEQILKLYSKMVK